MKSADKADPLLALGGGGGPEDPDNPKLADVLPIREGVNDVLKDSDEEIATQKELRDWFLEITSFTDYYDFLLSPTRFDQLRVPSFEDGKPKFKTGRDVASAILGREIKFTGPDVMRELADKLGMKEEKVEK